MVLAGRSIFTMERLWGFPDQSPKPAHKACSSSARGDSTVGREQGGYGLAPRTLPLWKCKWGQCLNGPSWSRKLRMTKTMSFKQLDPGKHSLFFKGCQKEAKKKKKKKKKNRKQERMSNRRLLLLQTSARLTNFFSPHTSVSLHPSVIPATHRVSLYSAGALAC